MLSLLSPDWDLKIQLERERKWRGLSVRSYLRRWIDLKKAFSGAYAPCGPFCCSEGNVHGRLACICSGLPNRHHGHQVLCAEGCISASGAPFCRSS